MPDEDKTGDNRPGWSQVAQDKWFSRKRVLAPELVVPTDELDDELQPELPPQRTPSRLAQWWQKRQAARDEARQAKLNAKIDDAPAAPPVYANDEEPPPDPPRRWMFQPRWPRPTTFQLSVTPDARKVMFLCFLLFIVCGALLLWGNQLVSVSHRLWPVVSAPKKTQTTITTGTKKSTPAPVSPPFVPANPPLAVQPSAVSSMPSDAEIARIGKATGSKASVEEVKLIIKQLQASQSKFPLVAPVPPPSK